MLSLLAFYTILSSRFLSLSRARSQCCGLLGRDVTELAVFVLVRYSCASRSKVARAFVMSGVCV